MPVIPGAECLFVMHRQGGQVGMGGVIGGATIIGRLDEDACDELRVFEPRADASFDLVQQQVGGDHQGQAVDVADNS